MSRAALPQAPPAYGANEIQPRLEALNAWCTTTRSLRMQHRILRNWTGSEDLAIAARKKTLVERLLKESALQDTFDKRTLSALNSLLDKSKQTVLFYAQAFQDMHLPSLTDPLQQLASFPISLVQQALVLRLESKERTTEPPKQMGQVAIPRHDGRRSRMGSGCLGRSSV
ncbi:hypothetical protein G6F68_016451 [Rhizopus microsporus]|nr:hypothetical protein G6F68_016451 [Rhizopus microsporus]